MAFRIKQLIALLLSLTLCAALVGCKTGYYTVEGTVFSSGMVFSARIFGGNEKATAQKMQDYLVAADGVFNANLPTSEITKVNKAATGERVEISKQLWTVASLAKELSEVTDGAFDCTLSPISELWGVDVDGIAKYCYGGQTPDAFPTEETLISARAQVTPGGYELSEDGGRYYLTKTVDGLTLDFGGIAKGYCADALKLIATENGVKSGVISISGNTVLIGNKTDGSKWGVGVNNPRRKSAQDSQYVCGFYESGVSVVTSGDYERYYEAFGTRVCHVIDGKTLLPVGVERTENGYANTPSYVISATVIGEISAKADAYATAVMVLGLEKGAQLLRSNGYKGVIFTSDGKYAIVGDMEMSQSETLYLTEYTRV